MTRKLKQHTLTITYDKYGPLSASLMYEDGTTEQVNPLLAELLLYSDCYITHSIASDDDDWRVVVHNYVER